jgi:hypothetical protein
MTPDYLAAASALFSAFTFDRLLPAALMAVLFSMFVFVLARAQKRGDFDASEFLREDSGKLSSKRLFAFIAMAVHVWLVTTRTISDKITFEEQVLFVLTWSGSLVLIQALEIWKGGPPSTAPPREPPA